MALTPWVVDGDVDWTGVDPTVSHADAIAAATDILFDLAGRQYGPRNVVDRPNRCWPACNCQTTLTTYDSQVSAVLSGTPLGSEPRGWLGCYCAPKEVSLRLHPVTAITYVKVNGAALTQGTNYLVYNARTLVRIDGTTWPCCQDIYSPSPGAFEVSYTFGRVVPPAGKRAAAVLAREYALGANPTTASKCRLPATVQRLTRSGVTHELRSALINNKGQIDFGIPEVTTFLAVKNPTGQRRRTVFASPDQPGSAIYTPIGP